MENFTQKEQFLRNQFASALKTINPNTAPLFGKMNPQQMVEHMADYIRLAYGNPIVTEVFYTLDAVGRLQLFLQSEKLFRENTANPLMSEEPKVVKFPNYEEAVADVETAIESFFEAFAQNPHLKIANPFFGLLDFPLTIHLLSKHGRHHLRQFNIEA